MKQKPGPHPLALRPKFVAWSVGRLPLRQHMRCLLHPKRWAKPSLSRGSPPCPGRPNAPLGGGSCWARPAAPRAAAPLASGPPGPRPAAGSRPCRKPGQRPGLRGRHGRPPATREPQKSKRRRLETEPERTDLQRSAFSSRGQRRRRRLLAPGPPPGSGQLCSRDLANRQGPDKSKSQFPAARHCTSSVTPVP